MTVQEAARELRSHMRHSQQSMATELGLSMGALRNYESGAVQTPDARACVAYILAAKAAERPDLGEVFKTALRHVMGVPEHPLAEQSAEKTLLLEPVNWFEDLMVDVLFACIRGQGHFRKHRQAVFRAFSKPAALVLKMSGSLHRLPQEGLEGQLAAWEIANPGKRHPIQLPAWAPRNRSSRSTTGSGGAT